MADQDTASLEERKVAALEYIAKSLARIDNHLLSANHHLAAISRRA